MRRVPVLGVALFLLAACGSDSGNANARLEGTYQGPLVIGGQTIGTCTLTATQVGNASSGSFVCGNLRGTFVANVNGSQFNAVISAPPQVACNATGSYDDNSLSGTLARAGGATGEVTPCAM